jgi:transposase
MRFKKKGRQSIGRGRKGVGTKIHVALSSETIQGACLSASNQVDMNAFALLWLQSDWRGIDYIVADKGYDCGNVGQKITDVGKIAVIPRKKGAIYPGVRDKERYKTRSAIERFFGKIKDNKRLALRFDKLEVTFFSFFALSCLKVLNLLW